MLSLPMPLQRALAGAPIQRRGRRLDVQIQVMLRLQKLAGGRPWYEQPLPQARRQLDIEAHFLTPATPSRVDVQTIEVQGAAGTVQARLYRPQGLAAPAPALLYCHGGGFVLGSLESHDIPCRLLATQTPCVVIAVDYRLAPEHRFPAGRGDAVAAFRDIAARAGSLGIDVRRIAVGGDSAGGNLAAAIALDTRGDESRPCHQLLIYPTVDATLSMPSIRDFAEGFLLTKTSMDWFCDTYFEPTQDRSVPAASPLFADVAGAPPATIHIAGFDPLCDEGEAYAQHLRKAGVDADLRCHEGLVHGYLNMSGVIRSARAAVDELVSALQRALR